MKMSICELFKKKEKITYVSFRNADRKNLREITSKVIIETNDVTETNHLINVEAVYVSKRLGLKQRKSNVPPEPFWGYK